MRTEGPQLETVKWEVLECLQGKAGFSRGNALGPDSAAAAQPAVGLLSAHQLPAPTPRNEGVSSRPPALPHLCSLRVQLSMKGFWIPFLHCREGEGRRSSHRQPSDGVLRGGVRQGLRLPCPGSLSGLDCKAQTPPAPSGPERTSLVTLIRPLY